MPPGRGTAEHTSMPLERKVRVHGSSLTIVIPHDVAKMLDLAVGDSFAFEVIGRESMALKLLKRRDNHAPAS